MDERKDLVTFKGEPLTLIGKQLEAGQPLPESELLDNGLAPVKLSSLKGRCLVVSVVPSLDTPVCDAQTRRFNEEASNMGEDVTVLTVSMDLPFAQARWCGAAGIDGVMTLSDHREGDFGLKSGLLIKELRLLARAVFVVDTEGIIRYKQLVKEVASEPDYEAAIEALKSVKNSL